MDTFRAFTAYRILKLSGHIMIKKEWFFWPMSLVLNLLGGIPVDRNAPRGAVGQMVERFRQRDDFLLAMVPEGTRKAVKTIKTGFWHIARDADVSIVCWYLDNPNRITRWLGEIHPSDDKVGDLLKIQDLYARAGYRFPLDPASL
jgi:1-acyl-sn-glycerol-3-phosphate acyltransferase